MSWRVVLATLAGTLASFFLIYYARDISKWIVGTIWQTPLAEQSQGPTARPLMSLTSIEGSVYFRESLLVEFEPLRPSNLPLPLVAQNQIKTERGGQAILQTPSGYSIEINPESQVMVEQRRSVREPNPAQVYVMRGSWSLKKRGKSGTLYIVEDRKTILPEQATAAQKTRPRSNFVIDPTGDRAAQLNQDSVEVTALPPAPKKSAMDSPTPPVNANKKGAKMPPKKAAAGPADTLTNQYIEQVFSARSQLFRRCQLTSIRDGKLASGSYLFSLVIKPDGLVGPVRTLQTDITNKPLEVCLISVIERTRFKAFKGDAISISYPLNFQ